jgi:hypothetical protein
MDGARDNREIATVRQQLVSPWREFPENNNIKIDTSVIPLQYENRIRNVSKITLVWEVYSC